MKKDGLTNVRISTTRIVALLMNLVVVVMEIMTTLHSIVLYGAGMFQYYTIDSNLLALFSSFLYILLFCKKEKPLWLSFIQLMVTVNLTLTFLVALFVLSSTIPGSVRGIMLSGDALYQHTLCPILTFISFIFFAKDLRLTEKLRGTVILPTLFYAIVMILLNAMRVVNGPYPFLRVYEQPLWQSILWCIAILGVAFGLSCGIFALAKRVRKA